VTALYPDCSSRGPIVSRVVEKPAHGEVSFETGDVFPVYAQTSPFFCVQFKARKWSYDQLPFGARLCWGGMYEALFDFP
jgi:hypothetical protein